MPSQGGAASPLRAQLSCCGLALNRQSGTRTHAVVVRPDVIAIISIHKDYRIYPVMLCCGMSQKDASTTAVQDVMTSATVTAALSFSVLDCARLMLSQYVPT